MTRSDADPVFADAARAELERRVRDSARPAESREARPSRGLVLQLAVTAAVAVLIAAVLIGIDQARSRFVGARPVVPTTSEPTRTAHLIAPEGFEPRSDAELRSWGATLPENVGIARSVWTEQQIVIVHCMASKGFLFDPVYRYDHASGPLPAGHEEAYEEALSGTGSGEPEDWRDGGCTGLAEHRVGQG